MLHIREFLHVLLPYAVYGGLWFAVIFAAFRRAELALYLLIVLTPLPNLWYQIQAFPLGKDAIDLLTLAAFIGIWTQKRGIQRPPMFAMVIVFAAVTYGGLWNSSIRFNLPIPLTRANQDLADWKNYMEMILLYVLAYNLARDEEQQRTLIRLMAFVILLIAVREIKDFSGASTFSYDNRDLGPFWRVGLGANQFAAFLSDYGILLLGVGIMLRERLTKWLCIGSAAACVHPLFFAYSRGAYVGALAGLLPLAILRSRVLLVGLVVLVFTWQSVLPASVVERITMTRTANGQIEDSAAQRFAVWDHAAQLFKENPTFGIGFGGYKYTNPPYGLTDTHNVYMKVACEEGIVGLAMFALWLLSALYSAASLYRRGISDFQRSLALGFLGCLLSVIVTNIFGNRWTYYILGSYFWIAWGLVDRARAMRTAAPSAVPSGAVPSNALALGAGPAHQATLTSHSGTTATGLSKRPSPGRRPIFRPLLSDNNKPNTE